MAVVATAVALVAVAMVAGMLAAMEMAVATAAGRVARGGGGGGVGGGGEGSGGLGWPNKLPWFGLVCEMVVKTIMQRNKWRVNRCRIGGWTGWRGDSPIYYPSRSL